MCGDAPEFVPQRALEKKPGMRYTGLRRYGRAHGRLVRASHRDNESFSSSDYHSPLAGVRSEK